MTQDLLHLLRTRRFLPLFVTQFLGAFNDNVFKNALAILVTYRLAEASGGNAQLIVTLAAGLFILPFFLFSATAGQLADKFEKSRLIVIIKLVEIIIMLLASIGFYLQSIPIMMTMLFLLGMQATFFGPIKYAILPNLLHPGELIAGNGLIEAGTFVAILLGTISGGILILLPDGELIISLAIVAMSVAGFISSRYVPDTRSDNPSIILRYNFISETIRVIHYSKEREEIYLSILGISWFWLVGAVFLAEFPVYAKEILRADEHVVTWFLAIFSVGIAIGSLLCNRLLKGRVHATYVPIGAMGITLFAIDVYLASRYGSAMAVDGLMSLEQFLQSFSGWRISLDLLFLAICGGIYTVPLYAILQTRSEPSHRARVIASNNVINALFMVLAAIGTIVMLKLQFSVIDVFLTIALLNVLVTVYIYKLKGKRYLH